MKPRLAYGIALLFLVAGTTLALATIEDDHGPIPSMTGAAAVGGKPEELNCTLCHFTDSGDNLNTPGGRVEILNVPHSYTPGQTYPLTVRLRGDSTASSPTRKWGFQLTAVRQSDGTGVGTFVLPHPDTLQVVHGSGDYASRFYVEHTFIGTRTGLGGPVTWSFSWTAPSTAAGMIYFFCAGNTADGTGDPGNDFIFTTSDSGIPVGTTGVAGPIASRATLEPPSPNPSRGSVRLGFALPRSDRVQLAVFDLEGRRVRTLLSGRRAAGSGEAHWDGRRDDGSLAESGTYFARLSLADGARTLTRKVSIER